MHTHARIHNLKGLVPAIVPLLRNAYKARPCYDKARTFHLIYQYHIKEKQKKKKEKKSETGKIENIIVQMHNGK